ncbi:MAG: hypothetical protein GY835_11150 [bacterium]|nr:hypothetical protein [bacterium]
MKRMLLLVLMLAFASSAMAQATYYFGWEDGTSTVLGMYGPDAVIVTNVTAPDPVYMGSHSLKVVDNLEDGTPQAYLAYVTGLEAGDVVTAGFWRYDTTAGGSPSIRIWGGKTCTYDDINSYCGSAGGNGDYGPGEGWDYTEHTWTCDGSYNGIVIQGRTYSNAGDTTWVDELQVTVPTHEGVLLYFPETDLPVASEDSNFSTIKALY